MNTKAKRPTWGEMWDRILATAMVIALYIFVIGVLCLIGK